MHFIPESQVTLSYLLKFREVQDSYFTACSRVFQYHCKIWVAWLSMVKPTQLSGIRFLKLQQTKCYIITITVVFFKYFKILAKKNCKSCLGASLLPLLLPSMSWFCFHPATLQVPLLLSDSFGVVRLGSAAAPALTNYIFFYFIFLSAMISARLRSYQWSIPYLILLAGRVALLTHWGGADHVHT